MRRRDWGGGKGRRRVKRRRPVKERGRGDQLANTTEPFAMKAVKSLSFSFRSCIN
jgi:hypothetical protein